MPLTDIVRKLAASVVVCVGLSGCAYFKNYDTHQIQNSPVIDHHEFFTWEEYERMSWNEVIENIQTPREAQSYCNFLMARAIHNNNFDDGSHFYGFRTVHEGAPTDCSEAAYAAAALLSDDGYEPLVMVLAENTLAGSLLGNRAHIVFVYKQNDGFGSIGIRQRKDFNRPVFATLDALAKRIQQVQHQDNQDILLTRYVVINIGENDPDYITTNRNMQRAIELDCEIENE